MDNRPIGIFDSGLGGLTAVKELELLLPNENIIYFGDTGRVPYGSKGRDIIIKYAAQDLNFLKANGVKAALAACGTVSSVATNLGEDFDIPFTNVVLPTALAAAKQTKNGKIGVIATSATIASSSYRTELLKIDPSLDIFQQACPLFVPLVENGFVDKYNQVTHLVAEKYLASLKEAKVDTLILGCTHYPIISSIISSVMGEGVTLIDSGREAAIHCAEKLKSLDLLSDGSQKTDNKYFVSDTPTDFTRIAEMFLGHSIKGQTIQIDIEKY